LKYSNNLPPEKIKTTGKNKTLAILNNKYSKNNKNNEIRQPERRKFMNISELP